MKAIYPIIILAGALSSLAPSIQTTITGPADVNIHGVGQNLSFQQISAKTNIVGATTNFTFGYKSTTTNFTMNAGSLMALLENSLNTNFPAGSQLLLNWEDKSFYAFIVGDSTRTNLVLNPNQVLSTKFLSGTAEVASGSAIEIATNSPEDIAAGKETVSYTTALKFTYDDSALTNTVDGTHTKFTWVGLVHDKSSVNISNVFFNDEVNMDIIGSGSIRVPTNAVDDQGAVFTGTIRAKVSGFAP